LRMHEIALKRAGIFARMAGKASAMKVAVADQV
jgi:hypothetical protein